MASPRFLKPLLQYSLNHLYPRLKTEFTWHHSEVHVAFSRHDVGLRIRQAGHKARTHKRYTQQFLASLTKASGLGAINAPNPLMSSNGNSDNHGQLDALKDAVSSETSKWTVHRFVDALPDGLGFYLTVLKP